MSGMQDLLCWFLYSLSECIQLCLIGTKVLFIVFLLKFLVLHNKWILLDDELETFVLQLGCIYTPNSLVCKENKNVMCNASVMFFFSKLHDSRKAGYLKSSMDYPLGNRFALFCFLHISRVTYRNPFLCFHSVHLLSVCLSIPIPVVGCFSTWHGFFASLCSWCM